MFNDINQLKNEMKKELSEYLEQNFENNKYKYFYDTADELKKLFNLKFEFFNFNQIFKEKDNIKMNLKEIENFKIKVGEEYYNIKIDKSSVRGEFKISNINKLTRENKSKKYIKEYFLYYVFKELNIIDNCFINMQKNNFLYVYFEEYKSSDFNELKKDIYVKAKDKITYYQKLLNSENRYPLLEFLYIRKNYSNILEKIILPSGSNDTLNCFKKILEKITYFSENKSKKYFYRGQNNSFWLPSASIQREKGYLKNEHLMFHKIISKMPRAFEKDKYIYNQIATMQHFGYPTRLIDITENPLIALYFACDGNDEYDGEIFIYEVEEKEVLNFDDDKLRCLEKIPTKPLEEICKECRKEKICDKSIIKNSYIVQGMAQNERINNQSGSFIFIGIDEDKKCCENEKILPIKHIIIDKELKKGILEILENLNINGGTVYPDLLNLAKFLKNKYKNE